MHGGDSARTAGGGAGDSSASVQSALSHPSSSHHSMPNVTDLNDANAWVSYIDEDTQQAYWYNIHTGDTSWA